MGGGLGGSSRAWTARPPVSGAGVWEVCLGGCGGSRQGSVTHFPLKMSHRGHAPEVRPERPTEAFPKEGRARPASQGPHGTSQGHLPPCTATLAGGWASRPPRPVSSRVTHRGPPRAGSADARPERHSGRGGLSFRDPLARRRSGRLAGSGTSRAPPSREDGHGYVRASPPRPPAPGIKDLEKP